MFLFRVPSFAVGNCFFFLRGNNCTAPYYFSILFILPWIQSNDCLFVCYAFPFIFSAIFHMVSIHCPFRRLLVLLWPSHVAGVVILLYWTWHSPLFLPFCAWLKSLCALLWHQRQRQECFFCSREYTLNQYLQKSPAGVLKKINLYFYVYLYSFFITRLEISETGKINSCLFSVWLYFK